MYCILITFNINNEKNRVSLNIYPLKYTFKRSYYNWECLAVKCYIG